VQHHQTSSHASSLSNHVPQNQRLLILDPESYDLAAEVPQTPPKMSETVLRAEKDFSKDVDKLIPEAQELAKVRPLPDLALADRLLTHADTHRAYSPTSKPR
jgi:hypothetical protein